MTETTTTAPVIRRSSGVFGTKIPSSVALIVGVLLFLLPFVDIKCNNMSLKSITGLQLATGFKMDDNGMNNPFGDQFKNDAVDNGITKTTTNSSQNDPNMYALGALILGVLGFLISLARAKTAGVAVMVTSALAAAALIGLMIDIKKQSSADLAKQAADATLSIDFTANFYIAVIAFLAAAYFGFMRWKSV